MEEKKEKKLFVKWWFWLILLAIVIIVGLTIIMVMAFNLTRGEADVLSTKIQSIHEDAKIYNSIMDRTLILELNNWDNQDNEKLEKIFGIMKEEISEGKLQSYDRLITLSYIKSSSKDDALFIKQIYILPSFVNESTIEYVNFNDYQSMYNTLNKTMDGYTNLFNSIN